jgi:lycopene cyclase domain-containing protein
VRVDRWQYLIVLGACLLITAPLESFGRGVYRQPRRAVYAVLPVAVVFLLWDATAVAAHVWWYNPRFILGVMAPGNLPLEEILFFLVIPVCGLLAYSAVDSLLAVLRRRDAEVKHR